VTTQATPHERPLGARYRLDEPDGTWWELGWDRPLGTFYAQHHAPVPYDPHTAPDLLAWHGTDRRELPSVEALASRVAATIPAHIARELTLDAATHPNVGDPPFLGAARHFLAALERAAPTADPDMDHGTTVRPATGERFGVHNDPRRSDPTPGTAWLVPAEPLAAALRALPSGDVGDQTAAARDVALDPNLVQGVLSGTIEALPIGRVVEVCEALRCSPVDVWGANLGRQILHSAGDEQWPERLERPAMGEGGGEVSRHRIDGRGRYLASDDTATEPSAHHDQATALHVTCYRQTGVLAIDATGAVSLVEDLDRPADPAAEYHFAFRQLADPQVVEVSLTSSEFARGCPRGHDAEPRLVRFADNAEDADLIRFADPSTGAEAWLGRETPFDDWQTWDDPRSYFPGDPDIVVDAAGFAEHATDTLHPIDLRPAESDFVDLADPRTFEPPPGASFEPAGLDF